MSHNCRIWNFAIVTAPNFVSKPINTMRYFGFNDEYNMEDQQQKDIKASLQSGKFIVMNYEDAKQVIRKFVYAKFKNSIAYGHKDDYGEKYSADKKELLAVLPGVDSDMLQVFLDAMYEEGKIRKDNGVTVYFTVQYVFSTPPKGYFGR